MNKLIGGLIAVAVALGMTACSIPAKATPATTVTATVTPAPVIKYEYIEKVKEVTPQVCLDALTKTGAYLLLNSESGDILADIVQAAYDRSTTGLEVGTEKLKALRVKMEEASKPMIVDITACRAKGAR